MKKIISKHFPFRGFIAMNLFGVLIVREEHKHRLSETIINHEEIHTSQMKEMLYIFFYIWYFTEWVIKLFIYGKDAYRNISFEREANDFERFPELRDSFGWMDYL